MDDGRLDREIQSVVDEQNCSGCGVCLLLDDGLEMDYDAAGFLRPRRVGPSQHVDDTDDRRAARTFRQVCPGRQVVAAAPEGATRHPVLGPVAGVWAAWAVDPELRFRGSSGGVLSALSAWVIDQGVDAVVLAAAQSNVDARRTVRVSIQRREDVLAAAGSRYAPVALGAQAGTVNTAAAVVAKPCEISALSALHEVTGQEPRHRPLYLSFFCAGTPSQQATDALAEELGASTQTPSKQLWYRGRGWPGRFTVRTAEGSRDLSYEESWGHRLGPALQWRCKVCADGVGESADISAGDLWTTNERGYPTFEEAQGVSALVARTLRGRALVLAAAAAGVIEVRPVEADDVAAVQPLQTTRRATLAGRLIGARVAGRRVPRYIGFRLLRQAASRPREVWQTMRATSQRVRAAERLPDAPARSQVSGAAAAAAERGAVRDV